MSNVKISDLPAGTELALTDSIPVTQSSVTKRFAASTVMTSPLFTPAGTGAVPRDPQEKMREIVSPEDYGAVGDGATDDTAALALLVTYANSVDSIAINFNGLYKSTATMALTTANLTLNFTKKGISGLYFIGCNGLSVTQTDKYDGFRANDMLLITDSATLYTGFSYTNSEVTTGDAYPKVIDGLVCIGYDRYTSAGGTYLNGWLTAASIANGDRFHISNTYLQGPENDRTDEFPVATIGLDISDSSTISLTHSAIVIFETGVRVRGQSEGVELTKSAIVACKYGVDFQCSSSPANNFIVADCHIASMFYNINLGVGGSVYPIMHKVTGCLLFTRTESMVSATFQHIKMIGQAQIIGNYFFTATAIDPATHIGVDIYGNGSATDNGTQVAGNYFYRVTTLVNIQALVSSTFIVGNTTRDDGTTSLAAPIADAGTSTVIGLNAGDRDFGEVKSDTGVFWAPTGSPGFYVSANKLKALTGSSGSTSAVNYLDGLNSAAGSPVQFRALGTDTDIDLLLLPKGAGLVRIGTFAGTGDVAVNGYITIKDAGGTSRKIATVA